MLSNESSPTGLHLETKPLSFTDSSSRRRCSMNIRITSLLQWLQFILEPHATQAQPTHRRRLPTWRGLPGVIGILERPGAYVLGSRTISCTSSGMTSRVSAGLEWVLSLSASRSWSLMTPYNKRKGEQTG